MIVNSVIKLSENINNYIVRELSLIFCACVILKLIIVPFIPVILDINRAHYL